LSFVENQLINTFRGKMKKTLSLLLSLVLAIGAFPVPVLASPAPHSCDETANGDTITYVCASASNRASITPYEGSTREQVQVWDEQRWYYWDKTNDVWVLFLPSDVVTEVFTTGSQNTTSGTLSDVTGNGSSSTMGVTAAAQEVVQGECLFTADTSGTLPAITLVPTGPSGSTNRLVLLRAYGTSLLGSTVTGTLAGLAGASGAVYSLSFETKLGATPGLVRVQKSVTGVTPSFTIAANSHCTFKIIS
jgi:hypothetical protein